MENTTKQFMKEWGKKHPKYLEQMIGSIIDPFIRGLPSACKKYTKDDTLYKFMHENFRPRTSCDSCDFKNPIQFSDHRGDERFTEAWSYEELIQTGFEWNIDHLPIFESSDPTGTHRICQFTRGLLIQNGQSRYSLDKRFNENNIFVSIQDFRRRPIFLYCPHKTVGIFYDQGLVFYEAKLDVCNLYFIDADKDTVTFQGNNMLWMTQNKETILYHICQECNTGEYPTLFLD